MERVTEAGLVKLADLIHLVVSKETNIKGNPPSYRRIVATIAGLLTQQFLRDTQEPIREAIEGIAVVATMAKRQHTRGLNFTLNKLSQRLTTLGANLPEKTKTKLGRTLTAAYKLGVDEVSREMEVTMSFSLADQDGIAGLHESGLFWVGDFYGRHFDEELLKRKIKQFVFEEGLSYEAAGKELKRIFGEHLERSELYWQGLASTVSTRARSFGALEAMSELGVVSYEYINPQDERTSDICRALDGKIFSVKGAVALKQKLLNAKTPEEVKEITPWPKVTELYRKSGVIKTSEQLLAQGIAWPPLHFHCRSVIEVAFFDDIPEEPHVHGNTSLNQTIRTNVSKKAQTSITPWLPSVPTKNLGVDVGGKAWRRYILQQGYSKEEAFLLQFGRENDKKNPGLVEWIGNLDEEQEDLVGLVLSYLTTRPPSTVLGLNKNPPRYLSAADFGSRLRPTGREHLLGNIFEDVLTGNEWVVGSWSKNQQAAMVTAAAIYNAVGVAAVGWRLAEVDGEGMIAARAPQAWVSYGQSIENDPELAAQLPIDLFLAYERKRARLRRRLNPLPNSPRLLRWDLRAVMGYRAAGRLDENWGPVVDAEQLNKEHLVFLRKVAALTDKKIMSAIRAGGLSKELTATQYGTLLSRREILRMRLSELTA